MTDSVLKKQGIYIEMDALFDTRLSTIYQINDKALESVLNDNYFTREIDLFKGIDKEVFDLQYKNRDKTVLKNVMMNKVINMLRELVEETTKQLLTNPFHSGPKIFLNIYPYKLLPVEVNMLIKGLLHVTKRLADIEVISKSKEELTPTFIKNNLAILFMYEYSEWMELQAESFKKTPCPDICIIAPAIYFHKLPTKEEMDKLAEKQLTPFKAVEMVAAPLIGIKLYDVELFSANIK